MARRLQFGDYALQLFNLADQELLPVYRVQSANVDTDYRIEIQLELTDQGIVQYQQDVPVTVLSFETFLITEPPRSDMTPISWIATLAGKCAIGDNRKRIIAVGKTLKYHGEGSPSTTAISDFDLGETAGSARITGWLAVRDASSRSRIRKGLARVSLLANAQCTSLNFSFEVGGFSTGSATLEADGVSKYMKDLGGVDIDVKFASVNDTLSITSEEFSRLLSVWVNWCDLRSDLWSANGNSQIDFDPEACEEFRQLRSGDMVQYVFLPTQEKTWLDYKLATGCEKVDLEIEKSQVSVRMITDTSVDRVVHGFYPSRRDIGRTSVITYTDTGLGSRTVLLLKSGHVFLDGELYQTGFTDGVADAGTINTIVDSAIGNGRASEHWLNLTVTMLTGDSAGETREILDFDFGNTLITESFENAIQAGDKYRINGIEIEADSASDDAIYVRKDSSGFAVIETGEQASPPSDSVEIAQFTAGSAFTEFVDTRDLGSRLESVQSISYNLDLSRETVNELGKDQIVDRYLNKPVNVSTEMVILDTDEELLQLLTGETDEFCLNDYLDNLGLQVVVRKPKPQTADKPYEEDDIRLVFEVSNAKPINVGNTSAVQSSGEIGVTLLSDNFRLIYVVN